MSTTDLAPTSSDGDRDERPVADEPTPWPASVTGARTDYVVPFVHVRVTPRVVDLAFWSTLGAVAVCGIVDAPMAGAAAAGLFVVRRRHDHERSSAGRSD